MKSFTKKILRHLNLEIKRIDPSSKETNQGPVLPRTKDTRSHEFILGDMLLEREEMEFDFEYSHQDGDILIVKYNGHRFYSSLSTVNLYYAHIHPTTQLLYLISIPITFPDTLPTPATYLIYYICWAFH